MVEVVEFMEMGLNFREEEVGEVMGLVEIGGDWLMVE